MGLLWIVEPLPIAAIGCSRGTGVDNLTSPSPKEVWADNAAGGSATISIDLGSPKPVDTIFLGHVRPPAAGATWSIQGGVAGSGESVIQATTALRVPDVTGDQPLTSHALWTGAVRTARYLAITLTQPVGSPLLTAGVVAIGKAFVAELGQEWGGGRKPIDTGSVTPLSSGGFAVVEGARKQQCGWTFGDLSAAETDQLELIGLHLGRTRPGLVIENPDRTAGLRNRIHWGLFETWRPFERRNKHQTRWEVAIEQWI